MSVKSGLSYCLAYIATQHEYIRWDSQQQTKTNNIYRYCHSLLTWNRWTQNAGSHGQAGASSEHIKQHQTTDLIARLGAKFALCSSRSDSRMVRPQAAGPRLLYLTHPSPSHLYPPLFFLHTPRPQATRGSTRPHPPIFPRLPLNLNHPRRLRSGAADQWVIFQKFLDTTRPAPVARWVGVRGEG